MNEINNPRKQGRREFLKISAAAGAAAVVASVIPSGLEAAPDEVKPATNVADALKYPRNENSMPGKFPGKVAEILHSGSMKEGKPSADAAFDMVKAGMLALTGLESIREAWQMFFSPEEIIGIKVNPIAGALLSTNPEVVAAIIRQLEEAGIPKKNIVIWDRREFQLREAGFTPETFPGIRLTGTECQDEKESFYDSEGRLYSEARIDRAWCYWADVEETYDAETLPYMVNQGKESYFSKICTQEVDKIINVPVLKNAGASVTIAMKNLAYGAITNTSRLHKQLWSETCAEVCAFPPLRDKVVLNIVDGLRGCFNGGPAPTPQFVCDFNTVLVATDPVAVDRIGYDIILKKRISEGIQKEESPRGTKFMQLAAGLSLGIADPEKISRITVRLT